MKARMNSRLLRASALATVLTLGLGASACATAQTTDAGAGEAGSSDIATRADGVACQGGSCTLPHTQAVCTDGFCQVGACDMGFADIDMVAFNGCECALGASNGNCGTPSDLGMLAVGGMRMVEGLLGSPASENWTQVTFVAGGHPRIQFAMNPGMLYHFDVRPNCMPLSKFTCPDRPEGSLGLMEWAYFDTPPDGGMADGGTGPADDAGADADFNGRRQSTWPTTIRFRVTVSMRPTMCAKYLLIVSN